MILFSKPFFTCAGVAAVFLAVLCLACFLCALCPNAALFRYECLGICVPLLPTPVREFLYPRACRAGPGPIESNFSVGFSSGHLPHSWTCVHARSRGSGSSTRLCAIIHLCQGQVASRAARRRHRAGGPVPMGGHLEWALRRPVVVPGVPRGILLHQAGRGSPRLSRGRSRKVFRRRNIAG